MVIIERIEFHFDCERNRGFFMRAHNCEDSSCQVLNRHDFKFKESCPSRIYEKQCLVTRVTFHWFIILTNKINYFHVFFTIQKNIFRLFLSLETLFQVASVVILESIKTNQSPYRVKKTILNF